MSDKSESGAARAERWRKQIARLKQGNTQEISTEEASTDDAESNDAKSPESPRDFVRRRMRGVDSESEGD